MLDFLIPIIILVATAIWTYIAKGGVKILECFIITVIYMAIELSIRKVFKSVTDLVNTADEGALADILYHYGEERASRRIAYRKENSSCCSC